MAATRDALIERLSNVCETASLSYTRMTDSIRNGQERWKDILEKEARDEELPKAEQALMVILIEPNRISTSNRGPAKVNTVYNINHDAMGRMEKVC